MARAVVGNDDSDAGYDLNDARKARKANEARNPEKCENKAGGRGDEPTEIFTPACLFADDVTQIKSVCPKACCQSKQSEDLADDADPAAEMTGKVNKSTVLGDILARTEQSHDGYEQDKTGVYTQTRCNCRTNALRIAV